MGNDEFDRHARYNNPFEIIARLWQAISAREHSGRVPTAGFGATPSQVYGTRYRNMEVGESSGSQSYEDRQRDERLQKELEERDQRLMRLFNQERDQNRQEREQLMREREDLERRMDEFERFKQRFESRRRRREERHERRQRGAGGS